MKACQSKLITILLIGISTFQAIKQLKQGVQGLEAFAFCVVTVIDEHTKLSFKRKLIGLNLKKAYVPNCA